MYRNTSNETSMRSSASYSYLKKVDKIKAIPHPMGIVKWKGMASNLDLQSYRMGDQYAAALSKGLKHMTLENVNISNNRLTKDGTKVIINKLRPNFKFLNVSEKYI
eukprot:TRINITY_DN11450_c0_g1_i1.p1 TRINITY_DN11450_c0_g1~~TRINITY_DN11450_c0_g1_i1.p1  ORF type:complete len:106 (-),score=19.01 TRINITY_DN11450_c0_g1_i1:9-326(-)